MIYSDNSGWSLNPTETEWIFRGQYNDWDLIPSLFREEIRDNRIRTFDKGYQVIEKWDLPRLFEECDKLASSLFYRMDRALLPKPSNFFLDQDSLIAYDRDYFDVSHVKYALAQHVGFPTPLLDFSYDPYVAMYFMCRREVSECEREESENDVGERMVLWAIKLHPHTAHKPIQKIKTSLSRIDHSYTEIPSLRMQKGCFLFNKVQREEEPYLSFNSELLKTLQGVDGWETMNVFKLTLPKKEQGFLAWFLSKRGYTEEFLFPSIFNIAKKIKSNWGSKYKQTKAKPLYDSIIRKGYDNL